MKTESLLHQQKPVFLFYAKKIVSCAQNGKINGFVFRHPSESGKNIKFSLIFFEECVKIGSNSSCNDISLLQEDII